MVIKGLWVCGGSEGKSGGVLIQPHRGPVIVGGPLLSGVYLRFTNWKGEMKLRNRRSYARDGIEGGLIGENVDPMGMNWFRELGDELGCREVAWEVIQLVDGAKADHRKIDRLTKAIVALV